MKKNIKILIILIFVFIISGCTIKSDVVMDVDGKITEKVSVLNSNDTFNSPAYSKEEVINFAIEEYLPALNFRNYSYETMVGSKESGASFSNEYNNICSYFQDTGFNQYVYKHVDCREDDYFITIKNDSDYIPYCGDCSDWPSLNNITLKLTLPVNAEENNADEVDGTTYIWKYDENTKDKDFYIKISKVSLEENKRLLEEQERSSELKNKIITISIIVIFLLALGIVSLVFYKKYKRNKIDYK